MAWTKPRLLITVATTVFWRSRPVSFMATASTAKI